MGMFFVVLFINIVMAIICAMVASSKKGFGSGAVFFFYGFLIWPIALTHAILMKRDAALISTRVDGLLAGKPYRKLSDDSVSVIIEGKEISFSSLQEAEQALGAKAFHVENNSETELIGQKFEAKSGIGKAWAYVFLIALAAGAYGLKEINLAPEEVSIHTDYSKADQNDHPSTTIYYPPAPPTSSTGVYNKICRDVIDKLIQETNSPWSETYTNGNIGTMINQNSKLAFSIDCTNLKQKNLVFSFSSTIPSSPALDLIGKAGTVLTGVYRTTIENEVNRCLQTSLRQSEETIRFKSESFEIFCSATKSRKKTRAGSTIRIYEAEK